MPPAEGLHESGGPCEPLPVQGDEALPAQGQTYREHTITYPEAVPRPHWQSRARRRRSETLQIYFANVTSWSQRAEEYLVTPSTTMQASQVIAIAEHHKKGSNLVQMTKRLRKHSWHLTAVEAAHTGTAQVREGQGHGGVMVGWNTQ